MKLAKEIGAGTIIMVDGKPMIVLCVEIDSPNRTQNTYKFKMKNLLTNSTQEDIIGGDDQFDVIIPDKKEVTYSYFLAPLYVFTDSDYNQYEIEAENLGNALNYLQDGLECEVILFNGKAISIELSPTIMREVAYTEPAIKGDTSNNTMKAAKIASGFSIQVPLFVEIGDMIEIDTRTGEYKRCSK